MGINYSHQKLLGAIITMLATCDDVVVDVDEDGSNTRIRLSYMRGMRHELRLSEGSSLLMAELKDSRASMGGLK